MDSADRNALPLTRAQLKRDVRLLKHKIIVLSLLLVTALAAPSKAAQPQDWREPCGDPFSVSDLMVRGPSGTVSEVVAPDTLLLSLADGTTAEIHLAGLQLPSSDTETMAVAHQTMAQLASNQNAQVLLHSFSAEGGLVGQTWVGDQDLALELIQRGLARYQQSPHLTTHINCLYQEAQNHARQVGEGLWKR